MIRSSKFEEKYFLIIFTRSNPKQKIKTNEKNY